MKDEGRELAGQVTPSTLEMWSSGGSSGPTVLGLPQTLALQVLFQLC